MTLYASNPQRGGMLKPSQPKVIDNKAAAPSASSTNKPYDPLEMNKDDFAKAKASTYSSYQKSVDQNDLTSTHLNKLLDENNDYIKRAKTEGIQHANSRGLLNTSMAAGASHGAAIDRAAPIASQDAGTYNQRALANMAAENEARRVNASNQSSANLQNASSENAFWNQYITNENDARRFGAEQALDRERQAEQARQFNERLEFDKEDGKISRAHKEFLTKLDHDNSMTQLSYEASANLKGEYINSIDSIRKESIISISEIQNNPDIKDPKQKEEMIGIYDEEKGMYVTGVLGLRDADILATQAIYSTLPQWNKNWVDFPDAQNG